MTAGTAGDAARRRVRAAALASLTASVLLAAGLPGLPTEPASAQSLDQARAREQAARAELAESSAGVQVAGAELARVEAQLPGAQAAVATAKGELAGARAKATAARAAAERAEAARVAAQEEVDDATDEVEKTRDDVDQLARRAYQRGRLGDLREVMEATEPQDALARGEMLRSVFRSGTASLDRVTTSRLLLAGKTAALAEEEEKAASAREQATAQEARAAQAATAAEAAAAQVAALIADRAKALATAQSLREQDRREYEQAQADSRALAERIRRAAAAAAARAAAERAAAERAAAQRAARGRQVAPAPAAPQSSSRLVLPVRGRLSSNYGWRTHPIYGDRRFHAGWDIAAPNGTPIYAADDGVVLVSEDTGGYGLTIVLDHGGGLSTTYAHQSQLLVRAGQAVTRGQLIGRVGSTGNSTGNHLHWEVRVGGDPVDPGRYTSRP